jgi:hypothetical protein
MALYPSNFWDRYWPTPDVIVIEYYISTSNRWRVNKERLTIEFTTEIQTISLEQEKLHTTKVFYKVII